MNKNMFLTILLFYHRRWHHSEMDGILHVIIFTFFFLCRLVKYKVNIENPQFESNKGIQCNVMYDWSMSHIVIRV